MIGDEGGETSVRFMPNHFLYFCRLDFGLFDVEKNNDIGRVNEVASRNHKGSIVPSRRHSINLQTAPKVRDGMFFLIGGESGVVSAAHVSTFLPYSIYLSIPQ